MFAADAGALNFDTCTHPPKFMADVPPMGEADIKFLRWSDHFKCADMVAFSIDGDFIPIALIRRELQLLKLKLFQQQQQQQDGAENKKTRPPRVGNVAIFRIKYRPPGTNAAVKSQQQQQQAPACKKQRLIVSDGRGQPLGLSSSSQHNLQPAAATSAAAGARERASSAPREWEYVDIPKLHAGMQEAFTRICPMVTRNPLHRYHYMRMLAVLIGLSGTDFSRGLPHVGPGVAFVLLS
jgi:hypothetical protein